MFSKRKITKILRERIEDIWLFRTVSLIFGLIILVFLYKTEVIAIAFINGQPITVREVVKVYTSPDKENVLDRIISEKIIEYEAKKRNIQVKSDEIALEIKRIEDEAIANGKTMAQLLQESDKTAKDLEKEIRLKIIIYKILSEDIELSEYEIDRYIKDNPDLYQNLGEEEARERVRKFLIDARLQEEYKTWIQEAKAVSDVKYLIKLH
jgi:hypothetical protein